MIFKFTEFFLQVLEFCEFEGFRVKYFADMTRIEKVPKVAFSILTIFHKMVFIFKLQNIYIF